MRIIMPASAFSLELSSKLSSARNVLQLLESNFINNWNFSFRRCPSRPVTLMVGDVKDISESVNLNLSAESASIVISGSKGNTEC